MPPSYSHQFLYDLWLHSQQPAALVPTAERVASPRGPVMLLIFLISLFALSKQSRFIRIPAIVFFMGKHFGTGVILSTSFCHLLSDAYETLQDPAVKQRWGIGRWTGLIVLGSLLSIFTIEYVSTSYVDQLQAEPSAPPSRASSPSRTPPPPAFHLHGHGHGHAHDHAHKHPATATLAPVSAPASGLPTPPTPGTPAPTERTPLRPHRGSMRRTKSFAYGSPHGDCAETSRILAGHHRHELHSQHCRGPKQPVAVLALYGSEDGTLMASDIEVARGVVGADEDEEGDGREDEGEEVLVGRKRQVIGILVLQLGIMIHSLVIGLTLSITSGTEFRTLVTAITFHQLFEGLSLGVRVAGLPPKEDGAGGGGTLKAVLAVLFAAATPVGMLAGLAAFSGGAVDQLQLRLAQGVMSAVSAGMLIYAACVEMLAGDFVMDPALWRSGVARQALALGCLFGGVAAMALVKD